MAKPRTAQAAGGGGTPGHIYAVVGTGTPGVGGEGESALSSPVAQPSSVVVDAGGNIVFTDSFNHRVRRVDIATGLVHTIVGTGQRGFNGDGHPALQTQLARPTGLAYDPCGNLIIADELNHLVRRVSAVDGLVSTVAGTGGAGEFNGDGIPGTDANLAFPVKVGTDRLANVYIADRGHARIRIVDAETGIIRTVVGRQPGFFGDGGNARRSLLNKPVGTWLDCTDNLFIADQFNHRVRRVDAKSNIIDTIVGTGTAGYNGENVPALSADIERPYKAVSDLRGNVYFIEKTAHRLRKLDAATGLVTTVAGTGEPGDDGDGIEATSARLNTPRDLIIHPCGDLILVESDNHRVRRIVLPV